MAISMKVAAERTLYNAIEGVLDSISVLRDLEDSDVMSESTMDTILCAIGELGDTLEYLTNTVHGLRNIATNYPY